jgi:hypothetical protein
MLILMLARTAAAADPAGPVHSPAGVVAGANVTAMGGVGVAAPDDNVGITLNPGLMGLQRRYDMSGLFSVSPGEGIGWGGTAMDARTSDYIAAGFAYGGERSNPPLTEADLPGWQAEGQELTNIKQFHDLAGAIAVPILERKVSFGVAVSGTYYDQERQGSGWWWNGHLGAAYRPIEALTVGVVGRNLVPSTPAARDPEVLGGVRAVAKGVLIAELDGGWRRGQADPLLAAGLEKSVGGQGALRAGWRFEGGEHAASFGLGWNDDSGSIEYGVVVPLTSGKATFGSLLHVFSLRLAAPAPIPEE